MVSMIFYLVGKYQHEQLLRAEIRGSISIVRTSVEIQ
jgi:hypothetical protein